MLFLSSWVWFAIFGILIISEASRTDVALHNRQQRDTFDAPNPSQKPYERRLSDILTISFSTYLPPPRGLTQVDFYLSLVSSEVQVFHGFRSLIPFTDDPLVGPGGLTYRLNGIELHLEPSLDPEAPNLTYVVVVDILGALGSFMKEKSVAALQFSIYPTKEPRWKQIAWGFIDRDPMFGAGATNRSNPLIGTASYQGPPLKIWRIIRPGSDGDGTNQLMGN